LFLNSPLKIKESKEDKKEGEETEEDVQEKERR
jgi:hypothetical protein